MKFYLITGAVVIALAAVSNLAFGYGFEMFDHHGHGRHW